MLRKMIIACALLLLSAAQPAAPPAAPFSGCIIYENDYQTAAGDQLYFAVKPKNWFYIQGNNLKMYDRNKKLQELYLGDKNEYYYFEKGQPRLDPDTARPQPRAGVQCLPTTATILGYRCQMLRRTQGSTSSLVFYSPELRVDPAGFCCRRASGWYALLLATDGALPLRTITVDARHDVTVITEAIAVQPMALAAADFTPTAPAR